MKAAPAPPPVRSAPEVRALLLARTDPKRAASSAWFFKTGPGGYGEGDRFFGVTVPLQRRIANAVWRTLPLGEVSRLLQSEWHEERLTALLVLVQKFKRAEDEGRREIYQLYLAHAAHINNWDLVDTSASTIVGGWLLAHPQERPVLRRLARSSILWERRIAMLATFAFIRDGQSEVAFGLARRLLNDRHDLMHKAVGWMLREAGKRQSNEQLRAFLKEHAARMPRTALRYAIEHFSPAERKRWLGLRRENQPSRGGPLMISRR